MAENTEKSGEKVGRNGFRNRFLGGCRKYDKQISAEPKNNCKELQNVSKIDIDICNRIIMLNLRKANYLVDNDRNTPTIDDFNDRLNQDNIFDRQYSRYRDEKLLPVLNISFLTKVPYINCRSGSK